MRLQSLTLDNFGLYAGRHHFDLTTKPDNDPQRNIVLFQGHNGAGKSTLFAALALAFHGVQALGDRIGPQQYNDYLLNRLHRQTRGKEIVTEQKGSVAVCFEYVQSGRPLRLRMQRNWQRNKSVVTETLSVEQEEESLSLDPSDYQNWLNELLPPGLTPLCFFDAERLDTFASPEQHRSHTADTLRRLLGLELVERLVSDLNAYTNRQAGSSQVERLRIECQQYEETLNEIHVRWTQLLQQQDEEETRARNLRAELREQELRYAAEGGNFAERRPGWQERLSVVKHERETVEGELREVAGQLLPFALVPDLCRRLNERLIHEARQQRGQVASQLWQHTKVQSQQAIAAPEMWQDIEITATDQYLLATRFLNILETAEVFEASGQTAIVHHLSDVEQERLQECIVQARRVVPDQVLQLGQRLREYQAEQRRLEENLARAPNDESLVHLHSEIKRLEQSLAETNRRQTKLAEERGALVFQRSEIERARRHKNEEWEAAALAERQVALATSCKITLRAYQERLTSEQIKMLETNLIVNFNRICRKKQLLPATEIDPRNLNIQLQSVDGQPLHLSDFSAGERQLYALALLQAFRQVSGRQLPLLIDTPLARLDALHSRNLLEEYFPAVSDQVLLFATDIEMDAVRLRQVEPYLVRTYVLDYDAHLGRTQVVEHAIADDTAMPRSA